MNSQMNQDSRKIVLPPFLIRRLEAFRIVKDGEQSYVVRDKLLGTTHDFDPWQFFILEVLPGCETVEKLQGVFKDRFDREITRNEMEQFFASLADRKLLDQTAAQHPLLARFTKATFSVEDGKATVKPFGDRVGDAPAEASAAAGSQASADGGKKADEPADRGKKADEPADRGKKADEPADREPPLGLDWPDPKIKLFLFDPRPVLRWLAPALKPLWRVIYATPLLLFIALYIGLYKDFDLIYRDTGALQENFTLVAHLIFAWLTVHFLGSMSAAVVATNYRVSVEKVGFYPTFGFMPRWCLKMTGANLLTRKQMMWTHAAPLLMRLVLLSFGILLWFNTRGTHVKLSQIGLLTMFICFVGLTLEAGNPLLKAHAYYILCAYLNEPHLRAKAFLALWNRLRGNVYQAYDRKALAIYGLCTLVWIAIVTLIIAKMLGKYLLGDLHLNGSAIIIIGFFIGWMTWLTHRGLKKFGEDFDRKLQFDRWRSRALPAKDLEAGEVKARRSSYWKPALIVCAVLVMFLPYHYEPDGQFVVYPVLKEDLTTDTPGVIDEVFFDGGESVKKGTVLARLAHDNYVAAYNTLTAQIEEQKHLIANLKTLPKPEAVKLAAALLQIAREHEPFSRAKVERLRPLQEAGAITFEELDTNVKEHAVDVQQIAEKEANLALVKTGPTAEEIAASESKLESLKAERDGVQAKLDRTFIRMPFDGNILTLHLKDRINSYLDTGKPFASVENTGYVNAQIQIQESDLQFVKIGMEARARPTSYFFDEFKGRVVQVDRNVTDSKAGTWVNVIALFDNKDGRLHTGASGEAKIGPVTLPVWQAFTLSIEHFFLVDVWGWLP
jgi:putative peptide zinc metalloprotease protein